MNLNTNFGHRRLLLVAVSALLLTSNFSQAEDAGNLYNTNFDINAGECYFGRQCSPCHGFDAKGNDETGAPDLTGILSRASTPRQTSIPLSAMELLALPCWQ